MNGKQQIKFLMERIAEVIEKDLKGIICPQELNSKIAKDVIEICKELRFLIPPKSLKKEDFNWIVIPSATEITMSKGRVFSCVDTHILSPRCFNFYASLRNIRGVQLFEVLADVRGSEIGSHLTGFSKEFLYGPQQKPATGVVAEGINGELVTLIQKEFETSESQYWEVLVGGETEIRYISKL